MNKQTNKQTNNRITSLGNLQAFFNNESGVYGIITALLSFIILAFAALVIDGTGIIQDRTRFVRGLEQSALFLTAENNHFRHNKNVETIQSQYQRFAELSPEEQQKLRQAFKDNFGKSKDVDLNNPQTFYEYLRNIEMISGIARSYYIPNQLQGYSLKDRYNYLCKNEKTRLFCKAHGSFDRVNWMYLGETFRDHFGSFKQEIQINAPMVYAQKLKEGKPVITEQPNPVDIMVVIDNSYSMDKYNKYEDKGHIERLRFNVARKALYDFAKDLIDPSENLNAKRWNRLGFVSFAYGAQQKQDMNQCVLPYILQTNIYRDYNAKIGALGNYLRGKHNVIDNTQKVLNEDKSTFFNYTSYTNSSIIKNEHNEIWTYYEDAIDYTATLNMIDTFDGTPLKPRADRAMIFFRKNDMCLLGGHSTGQYQQGESGNKNRTIRQATKYWYKPTEADFSQFKQDLNNLRAGGTTMSSSGVLIGANALAELYPEIEGQKFNPQKILVVLSDGFDGVWSELNLSKRLLDPKKFAKSGLKINANDVGMCDRIRKRLDSRLTNPNAPKPKSKIVFVSFDPPHHETAGDFLNAWRQCVGDENFYEVDDYASLLDALRKASTPDMVVEVETKQEEVGTIVGGNATGGTTTDKK